MRAAALLSFLSLSTALTACSGGAPEELATLDSSDYPEGKADSIANRKIVLYNGAHGESLQQINGQLQAPSVSSTNSVSVVGKTSDRIFLSTNPITLDTCYGDCGDDEWNWPGGVKVQVAGENSGVEFGQLISLDVRPVALSGIPQWKQYGTLMCSYTNTDGSTHRRRVFSDEVLIDFTEGTVTDLGWDGKTFPFSDCSGIDRDAHYNEGVKVYSTPVPVDDPAGLGTGKPYTYRVRFQTL